MDRLKSYCTRLLKSVWLFPLALTIILIILTSLGISGSSIGAYNEFFYGSADDPALIAGQPRTIRSDEWLVNSQAIITQSQEGYPRINPNIGEGQDMSVVVDVPYRDWSVLFKPHNLGFFFLPLENAFALRWWLMGYLLIISSYFFVLALLPGKRLIAAGLSLSIFFSGFVQWWYVYGTLGSLYFPFFIALVSMKLIEAKSLLVRLGLGAILAYLIAAFALVLYPPFQIPCAIVLLAFLLSHLATRWRIIGARQAWISLGVAFIGLLVSLTVVAAFIKTRQEVVQVITSTEYPGVRVIESGDFFPSHFFSSHLGGQFLQSSLADQYRLDGIVPTNQSEASNFLLLIPFLALPALALFFRPNPTSLGRDWPLLIVCLVFFIFLLELFVPGFTPYSKALFLHKVGASRALIGIGLLNLIILTLLIRNVVTRAVAFHPGLAFSYAAVVFLIQIAVSQLIVDYPGEFITTGKAILLSIPLAAVVFFLFTRRFNIGIMIFTAFSFYIGGTVNPLYKGLDIVLDSPLSQEIRAENSEPNTRWVSDGGYLINFAAINGSNSLSAVYSYPQAQLWSGMKDAEEKTYNRYAHVSFQFNDDPTGPVEVNLITPDSFVLKIYPCDPYLTKLNVGYIVTTRILEAPCLETDEVVGTPGITVYIYRRL